MRRALIAQRYLTACVALAFNFALDQHFDAVGQHRQLGLLARDDIREVINGAGKVSDFFFEVLHGVGDTVSGLYRSTVKMGRAGAIGGGPPPCGHTRGGF